MRRVFMNELQADFQKSNRPILGTSNAKGNKKKATKVAG